MPWAVTSASDCPDTQSVYTNAINAQAAIRNNLSGIVAQAVITSPSVKILNVGYAYAVDQGSPCFPNRGGAAGVASLIDLLNDDHKAITGPNVRYVDLTAGSSLGTQPIANNYIQKTRLYGYPHPSATGQVLIAATAVGLARNAW